MNITFAELTTLGVFSFSVTILLIGYIFVEYIIDGNLYLNKVLTRYKRSYFDRIVHYIFWGFIANLMLFLLIPQLLLRFIADQLGFSGASAKIIAPILSVQESTLQLGITVTVYTVTVIIILVAIIVIWSTCSYLLNSRLPDWIGKWFFKVYKKQKIHRFIKKLTWFFDSNI